MELTVKKKTAFIVNIWALTHTLGFNTSLTCPQGYVIAQINNKLITTESQVVMNK